MFVLLVLVFMPVLMLMKNNFVDMVENLVDMVESRCGPWVRQNCDHFTMNLFCKNYGQKTNGKLQHTFFKLMLE